MKVVRDIIILGNLKVATLTHIWVEWLGHPGVTSGLARAPRETRACPGDTGVPGESPYGMPPRLKEIYQFFMTRSLPMQPQVNMGSGLVDPSCDSGRTVLADIEER
jgi:hypothetical protein